jgi:NADH:ubiquinone oxidoreductase subunit C
LRLRRRYVIPSAKFNAEGAGIATFKETAEKLKAELGANVQETSDGNRIPYVKINAAAAHEAAAHLYSAGYDSLLYITAKDYPDDGELELVWYYFSYGANEEFFVKARVQRTGAHVPTITDIYAHAEWQEDEVYEMFGVTFDGHPNPRRLLTPEWLGGHPLLKDYENPDMEKIPNQ